MLAFVGRPSLHGYYACMACWTEGALWRNCGQKQRKTSFSPLLVFCSVRILGKDFGVHCHGIFGLGGPGILGHPPCPVMLVLSLFMLGLAHSW